MLNSATLALSFSFMYACSQELFDKVHQSFGEELKLLVTFLYMLVMPVTNYVFEFLHKKKLS